MNSTQEDGSTDTQKRKVHPLLILALAAVFVFSVFGVRDLNQPALANLAALSASASFAKGEISSNDAPSQEFPELVLVSNEALKASTPPITVTSRVLGAIIGQVDSDTRPEIIQYEVEEGDTLASLAQKFNVSINTIAWANDLQSTSTLKPGQDLVILPISGALHMVRPSDTLSEIASWYQASVEDIVQYNNLASASEIFTGDLLVIPNGIMPKTLPQGRLTPVPNSYFIYPIPSPHRITQGLHPFNAVDFSNGICGDSVYAAAGGTVQRTGYTSLGGNYVRIIHPNGVVTYYGHLSAILVSPGAKVYQGQIVGYTGYTGYTIPRGPAGCHVHFEVRGAENPFAK